MTPFQPLREKQNNTLFNTGDLLVLFGEVFDRGYVNGLIEEAQKNGLTVIYSTVGRRNKEGELLPLSNEELDLKKQSPLINIPMEAGFDLEPSLNGLSPVDQLKDYGLKGWETAKLDWKAIEQSRTRGTKRFRQYTQSFLAELKKHWSPGKNVLFAHTMAGGFPRAKVVMPIANRLFKGSGSRFQSSAEFWQTDIGKLCALSFQEVTAETFRHLIECSEDFRKDVETSGAKVRYLAYGYHGNETMKGEEFEWFSYSPYLQGWAKCELENISEIKAKEGVSSCVFNVPEILTNSSSIFLGIEIALYSLIRALQKTNASHPKVTALINRCEAKLKDGSSFKDVDQLTQEYLLHPVVRNYPKFATWPQHNSAESMSLMCDYSARILALHKDSRDLLTSELSEVIFRTTGHVMFHELSKPRHSVAWIGHDLVSKIYLSELD